MDIVDDFLYRLRSHIVDFPADEARAIEAEIRRDWGGTDGGYVRKGIGTMRRQQVIGESLAQGLPITDAFERAGVCPRHGFRILNRK